MISADFGGRGTKASDEIDKDKSFDDTFRL